MVFDTPSRISVQSRLQELQNEGINSAWVPGNNLEFGGKRIFDDNNINHKENDIFHLINGQVFVEIPTLFVVSACDEPS